MGELNDRELLLDRVCLVAASQIGQRETSHNRGPAVDIYIRSVGLSPVSEPPWCQAFVNWCFDTASAQLALDNPLPKAHGSVHKLWELSEEHRMNVPTVGAIFCQDHGAGKGHCGIITAVHSLGMFTIEGNTSEDGTREGTTVCARWRDLIEINLGYLRFA